jgi:hypothetical protein
MRRFSISTVRNESELAKLLQDMAREIELAHSDIATLRREGTPRDLTADDFRRISTQLRSSGVAPLDVTQLIGILAQSQRGFAVVASSAATLPDPSLYEIGTIGAVISGATVTFYTVIEGAPRSWLAVTSTASTHDVLSATHSDSLAGTVVRGDVVVGNSTPKWSRLPRGSANQVLRMDSGGNDPAWGTVADSMLSANVALEDALNVFSAVQDANAGLKIGGSTTVLGWTLYTPSLAPTAVSAASTNELTFPGAVTGSSVGDIPILVKPTHQSGLGIVGVRVPSGDDIAITYMNVSAGSITPTTETYRIFVLHF